MVHTPEMREPRPLPSQEYLHECFDYNPDTGTLTWRERPRHHFVNTNVYGTWNTRFAGQIAGTTLNSEGRLFRIVGIDGQPFLIHRIIFKLMTNRDPRLIDHRNRDAMNNCWNNLREATNSQSNVNTRVRRTNRTGFKGVVRLRNDRYRAQIRINKKAIHLGYFSTPEAAHAVYVAAAKAYWDEFVPSD